MQIANLIRHQTTAYIEGACTIDDIGNISASSGIWYDQGSDPKHKAQIPDWHKLRGKLLATLWAINDEPTQWLDNQNKISISNWLNPGWHPIVGTDRINWHSQQGNTPGDCHSPEILKGTHQPCATTKRGRQIGPLWSKEPGRDQSQQGVLWQTWHRYKPQL